MLLCRKFAGALQAECAPAQTQAMRSAVVEWRFGRAVQTAFQANTSSVTRIARAEYLTRAPQTISLGKAARCEQDHQERLSLSMLQKRARCSIASANATCVCGKSSNHRFGIF